ncbi:hypothetical protein BJ165DRAFT_1401105 [Panaeolus papilionaceus]|nr:hypothetical protein BJ165DRAFT_1401105 [Panaeolus papilionaceus]
MSWKASLTSLTTLVPNEDEKHTSRHKNGTTGAGLSEAMDGRDDELYSTGSDARYCVIYQDANAQGLHLDAITNSLRMIDEELQGVVLKLRSALQDVQLQLMQSEGARRALCKENVELKEALASMHLDQQREKASRQAEMDRLFGNALKLDASHAVDCQKNIGKTKAAIPSSQQLPQPASNYNVISDPPHSPIAIQDTYADNIHNVRFETNLMDKIKHLNSMITGGASSLGQSIVSVAPPSTNTTTPLHKDPEWQAAFQVSTSRLGKFLTDTITQEAQKPRSTLSARLIHITLTAFFTSLVAEWSGWYTSIPRSPPTGENEDGSEGNVSFNPTNSNRDVETALSEFASICTIATWNTHPDWDAAFEKQLSSFLSYATKVGPLPHDLGVLPSGTTTESGLGVGYRPLFVPPGSRFHADKMDDVYQFKENEKGARKTASCGGFGLSSGSTQDGTLRLLVKPKVVLESTLFEMLNPPQPLPQQRSWLAYTGTNAAHARSKGGRPSKGWKADSRIYELDGTSMKAKLGGERAGQWKHQVKNDPMK